MEPLIPVLGALVGAIAALAGNALTHLFGYKRARAELSIERMEKICKTVYAIRKTAVLGIMAAARGETKIEYPEDNDQLHWQVALYAPDVVPQVNEFLSSIREVNAACEQFLAARKMRVEDQTAQFLEEQGNLASKLSKKTQDLALLVVTTMRKRYHQSLMLP